MAITIVQQDLQYHVVIARHFSDKEGKHADENWKDWYELHDAGGDWQVCNENDSYAAFDCFYGYRMKRVFALIMWLVIDVSFFGRWVKVSLLRV